MPAPKSRAPDFGGYCLAYQYTRDQYRFLRSVEKLVPKALTDLRDRVLQVYIAGRKKRRSKAGKVPDMIVPNFRGGTIKLSYPQIGPHQWAIDHWMVNAPPELSCDDEETWQAFWRWVADYHFLEPRFSDLGRFPMNRYAAYTDINYLSMIAVAIRYGKTSSLTTFVLTTLRRVVFTSLEAWSKLGSTDSPLKWEFPPMPPTIHEREDVKTLANYSAQWIEALHKASSETLRLVLPAVPPLVYSFDDIKGWDMLREERQQAKKRIMDELEEQVIKWLTQQEHRASYFAVAKYPVVKSEERQFDWLARYQIDGTILTEIANDEKAKPEHKYSDLKSLSETVRNGIRTAARRVVGPEYSHWLLPTRRGRPRKPK